MFAEEKILDVLDYAEKYGVRSASGKFSVPVSTIYSWRKKKGVGKPFIPRTFVSVDAVKAAVEKNPLLTIREASEMFSCSVSNLRRISSKYGIRFNSKKVSVDDVEAVTVFFRDNPGARVLDAVKALSISYNHIHYILTHYDLPRVLPNHSNKGHSRLNEDEVRAYIARHPKATYRELGEHFHISRQGIFNFLRDRHIEYRAKRMGEGEGASERVAAEIQRVKDVFDNNDWKSFIDVSRRAGVGLFRVYQCVEKYNIPVKSRCSISRDALRKALLEIGSYKNIAAHFNVSCSTIGRLIGVYGLQRRNLK